LFEYWQMKAASRKYLGMFGALNAKRKAKKRHGGRPWRLE
tara:strand:+ start:1223 stop:1342 length:120 start_codon:yes stop_codon:yes gene_type:complete